MKYRNKPKEVGIAVHGAAKKIQEMRMEERMRHTYCMEKTMTICERDVGSFCTSSQGGQ